MLDSLPVEERLPYLVERTALYHVEAKLVFLVHGWVQDGDVAASLMVFDFSFLSLKKSHRIRNATIKLQLEYDPRAFFGAGDSPRDSPEIQTIVPSGTQSLVRANSLNCGSQFSNLFFFWLLLS